MTLDPMPDAELVARDWLAGRPALAAIVGVHGVTLELPPTPTWPRITLARIGGLPAVRRRLDTARIQVNAWGDPDAVDGRRDAHELARLARVELLSMEGYSHTEGYVTGVEDDLGLTWAPDTTRDPVIPRYVFGVALYLHP